MSKIKKILTPNTKPSSTFFKTDEIVINSIDGKAYIKNSRNAVLPIVSQNADNTTKIDGRMFAPELKNQYNSRLLRYQLSSGEITYSTSKKATKTNIITINGKNSPLTTDIFSLLNPVTFNYKTDPNHLTGGFIAEEIATVNPSLATWGADFKIDENGKFTKELNSTEIVPVDIDDRTILALCVAKIQELEAEIKELKYRLQ